MLRFDVVGVAWLVTRGLAYATARSGFAFTRSRHGETWLEANASLRGRLSSTRSLFPGCEEYCGAENTLVGFFATFDAVVLAAEEVPRRKARKVQPASPHLAKITTDSSNCTYSYYAGRSEPSL